MALRPTPNLEHQDLSFGVVSFSLKVPFVGRQELACIPPRLLHQTI